MLKNLGKLSKNGPLSLEKNKTLSIPYLLENLLSIPWTEEPGGLQPMGSQRVGHD